MDWSHLEMPFVLSLFPSCYTVFTLRRPYLSSVGVVLCFYYFLIPRRHLVVEASVVVTRGKEIHFYSGYKHEEWRLITSKRQINKQDNFKEKQASRRELLIDFPEEDGNERSWFTSAVRTWCDCELELMDWIYLAQRRWKERGQSYCRTKEFNYRGEWSRTVEVISDLDLFNF